MEEFLEEVEQISEEEPIIESQKTYSLLGIEMPLEEFDYLICEQNKGKELVVENGKVVARERIITQEQINKQKIAELKQWFDTEYRYKDEKYNRLIVLGKTDDDDVTEEVKRKDLYEEAEKVRKQIQEHEKLV